MSKTLAGASDDMEFQDSSRRVVALIEAMKDKLGPIFPSANNVRIPNAWIFISGEPVDQSAAN